MLGQEEHSNLCKKAKEVRKTVIEMMGYDRPHHFGGSLSSVEIITALYFHKMRYDARNPDWSDRDRFIMSKGHGVPTQYAALALLGVIPKEDLFTLKRLGSILQGHPNANLTPGIEAYTGSLGQGLSFANGIAMAARLRKQVFHVYVLLGDGELHEGQIWEAAMTTVTLKLSKVTAIIDNNHIKSQGRTSDAKMLDPLAEKWTAFGWHVLTIDGHDLSQICCALDEADLINDIPTMIIADTVKGKGFLFMENRFEFHNAPISQEQWLQAMKEIAK